MRRRQWDTTLYELAEGQAGYFTAAQARAAGLHQVRLAQLHQRGDIERVTRGVCIASRDIRSPRSGSIWKLRCGPKYAGPMHTA